MQKKIIKIDHPKHFHMVGDGFRVYNYLPGYSGEMSDNKTSPFIMLDYNAPWHIPPQANHRPGVGFHPHRGFETVTIVYKGEIEHQDTAGGGGIIGPDEVQWMTAGSGLLHNEFMTSQFAKKGGIQHAVQLWVNLPSKYKLTPPRYQALTKDVIPIKPFEGGVVRVLAGEYEGVRGIAETFSPIELYDIRFDDVGDLSITLPEGYVTLLLITEGSLMLGGTTLSFQDMAHLSPEGTEITLQAEKNTKILLMSGEPIDEPIVHYGPFVMNTEAEIQQAFEDFRSGKMGTL